MYNIMKQVLVVSCQIIMACEASIPIVVNTWPWPQATDAGWEALQLSGSALDAVERGCTRCEEDQCDGTVGFGGSPDENGETTLDAMIMDGSTMDVGAVACLRRVKNAAAVARRVLENTQHTMLAGELATKFAVEMGFREESLSTNSSLQKWKDWQRGNCQPNYRTNVNPDAAGSCGPYTPANRTSLSRLSNHTLNQENHDTIGMVAISARGNIVAGTSTNGLIHKVPGRVGDSPVPGAGAYADDQVGAAVATGDGDVMMRFLPAYQIVESMRRGESPDRATDDALLRILKRYPKFSGAVVAVRNDGALGASCTGFDSFHYCVRTKHDEKTLVVPVKCNHNS